MERFNDEFVLKTFFSPEWIHPVAKQSENNNFYFLHCVAKNVPPLVCYRPNFDARERILIFFGRNLTDKVSNQTTFYYVASNNVCFCTTKQNGEHENRIFYSNVVSVHCQKAASRSLISSVFLTHDSYSCCCRPIPKSGLLGAMVQEKGSRQRRSSWTVFHAQCMCTNALSSWKKKMSSVMCLIASNICWDGKISH